VTNSGIFPPADFVRAVEVEAALVLASFLRGSDVEGSSAKVIRSASRVNFSIALSAVELEGSGSKTFNVNILKKKN
jgi:hypothetical protein